MVTAQDHLLLDHWSAPGPRSSLLYHLSQEFRSIIFESTREFLLYAPIFMPILWSSVDFKYDFVHTIFFQIIDGRSDGPGAAWSWHQNHRGHWKFASWSISRFLRWTHQGRTEWFLLFDPPKMTMWHKYSCLRVNKHSILKAKLKSIFFMMHCAMCMWQIIAMAHTLNDFRVLYHHLMLFKIKHHCTFVKVSANYSLLFIVIPCHIWKDDVGCNLSLHSFLIFS